MYEIRTSLLSSPTFILTHAGYSTAQTMTLDELERMAMDIIWSCREARDAIEEAQTDHCICGCPMGPGDTVCNHCHFGCWSPDGDHAASLPKRMPGRTLTEVEALETSAGNGVTYVCSIECQNGHTYGRHCAFRGGIAIPQHSREKLRLVQTTKPCTAACEPGHTRKQGCALSFDAVTEVIPIISGRADTSG